MSRNLDVDRQPLSFSGLEARAQTQAPYHKYLKVINQAYKLVNKNLVYSRQISPHYNTTGKCIKLWFVLQKVTKMNEDNYSCRFWVFC